MSYVLTSNPKQLVAKSIRGVRKQVFHDFSITYDTNPLRITVTFRENGKDFAGFTLAEQINCCGIMVSTRTFVVPEYQGRGIAQEMMLIKEAMAIEFGYSSLLATVNVSGNPAEVHILEKCGWTRVNEFKNSKTENKVGVFIKNLQIDKKEQKK